MARILKSARKMLPGAACVALASLYGCDGGGASVPVPPDREEQGFTYTVPPATADTWLTGHAADTGMAVARLERMMEALLAGEFPVVDSIAIAHKGRLVLDEVLRTELDHADEFVANTDLAMHAQFSISKSFASALVGTAIDQGVLEGTDVPYLSLFPYDEYENADPRKDAITLHDVLTMRLGLDWNEWEPPYSEPGNQLFTFHAANVDFAKGLLDLPMAADPGSVFAYNTVATTSLGQAIENQAPLSLVDYGGANLLAPLGISRVEIVRTPTALPDIGRGLYLTTRDLLKLGQLYLDGGTWNGQRVVSSDWVSQSLVPYSELGWAEPDAMDWHLDGYGYQWWLGHFDLDGRRIESYAAWGFGAQWLMVIPELELVIAVNSHGREGLPSETTQPLAVMKRFVIPAALE
jgi:CubicO group peptidase (beta-lactamase class C family)